MIAPIYQKLKNIMNSINDNYSKNKPKKYCVLFTSNPMNHEGGVVNFWRTFVDNFFSEEIELIQHSFGSRMEFFYSPWKKRILYPLFYCSDYFLLIKRLFKDKQVRIVQVNPSLVPVPLIRDGLILLLSKLMGRKTIVFFHGWKGYIVHFLKKKYWARKLFNFVYQQADYTLVLSTPFKNDLISLGWSPSTVHITTTMYDSKLIITPKDQAGKYPRFLFLGRISQLKGVDELIEAVKLLNERGHGFECIMVGHGDKKGIIEDYLKRITKIGIEHHFDFKGHLTGKEKFQAYADSDVYVFPSWTEGCPTSVLEALGAGLFVVSSDVGALPDIIKPYKNGILIPKKNPAILFNKMEWCCKEIDKVRSRRKAISSDAFERFDVSRIIHQFKKIYRDIDTE